MTRQDDVVVIVALTILTAMCGAGAPMVIRAWRGESSLAEIPRYSVFARVKKKDRVRAGPAAFVSACLLCLTSWTAVLLGPADHMSIAAGIVFLAVAALWVVSFVAAPPGGTRQLRLAVRLQAPPCLVNGFGVTALATGGRFGGAFAAPTAAN
jgi:hypothetical protein